MTSMVEKEENKCMDLCLVVCYSACPLYSSMAQGLKPGNGSTFSGLAQ